MKLARAITQHAPTPQAISNKVLAELKQTFLEAYDENSDGKIDIREVSLERNLNIDCVSFDSLV